MTRMHGCDIFELLSNLEPKRNLYVCHIASWIVYEQHSSDSTLSVHVRSVILELGTHSIMVVAISHHKNAIKDIWGCYEFQN